MKTKRTSQYAKHGLPRPDSARFERGGGSRSNRVYGPGVASPSVHWFREAVYSQGAVVPGCFPIYYGHSLSFCTFCVYILLLRLTCVTSPLWLVCVYIFLFYFCFIMYAHELTHA